MGSFAVPPTIIKLQSYFGSYYYVICSYVESFLQALKDSQCQISEEEKIEHSKFILQILLPFLRRFNAEQVMEKEIEAKIRGSIILFWIDATSIVYVFQLICHILFMCGRATVSVHFKIWLGNVYCAVRKDNNIAIFHISAVLGLNCQTRNVYMY